MAIYRYIVTVETKGATHPGEAGDIQGEIDSNLESVINDLGIEHFTVEPIELVHRSGFDYANPNSYKERVIRSIEQ